MNALTIDQCIEQVPSIGADHPHEDVSDKYTFMPTTRTLEILGERGWLPVRVRGQRTKDAQRRAFNKHFIWMRQEDDIGKNGESVFELILGNAHDRSARHVMFAGIYRLVCSNGLVIGTEFLEPMKITHINVTYDEVLKNADRMATIAQDMHTVLEPMQQKVLSEFDRTNFADRAMRLRYGDRVEGWPITPKILLETRRTVDEGKDLWTTFNVVQENIIKGGQIEATRVDRNGRWYSPTREISNLDRTMKLNQGLWDIANSFLN